MTERSILIVGGYGEVGLRLAAKLEACAAGRVVVAGRHPERARGPARFVDVDDPGSIERALEGVDTVVACARQRDAGLLRAAVNRGLAYTSIAPPWMPWRDLAPLREEARVTGARVVLAAGLEPGISSVLARAAADRLGAVESVESALLLGLGDLYGADSMAFIFEEVAQTYPIVIDGRAHDAHAFERPLRIEFPAPVGRRRAYTMPFRDQLYYPETLGARTAIARIALDPPWLGPALAVLLRTGLRSLLQRGGPRGAVRGLVERLRGRYRGRDHYALVVEVRGDGRSVCASLVGRQQADATAAGVAAITEALWSHEVSEAGVWLAEQVITPGCFFARLAEQGLVPVIEEPGAVSQVSPLRA